MPEQIEANKERLNHIIDNLWSYETFCYILMDELARSGFPHIAEEYDHDAYEAAIERFNASAGMDDRPCVPLPEHFRLDKESIPDVEWKFRFGGRI